MKVSDCMTANVECVAPEQSLQQAAQAMLKADAGVMPVGSAENLQGIITDRDIAVRGVAEGLSPDTPVSQLMSNEPVCIYDDQDLAEAAQVMADAQVRRLPVKNRDEQLVGIVSLGDLARAEKREAAAVALDGVSQESGRHNQSR